MDAGRELDALIAEKVMGLEIKQATREGWQYPVDFSQKGDIFYPASWGMEEVPEYSTDIAAAWQVVEELDRRGIWVQELSNRWENTWRCILGWNKPEYGSEYAQVMESAAPVAICSAALMAMEVGS